MRVINKSSIDETIGLYRKLSTTLLKIGVLNNTQLVLLNTLCVLQQHTLCAKLDDHYILAHLNVFVNTPGVLNSTVRNGSVFCNTPFI
jgi:hypothetical protein